jgi:glycosyltransferase involved in cell wall biosynthesis
MSKSPTVAIIIPAYNEEDTIEKCLSSCVSQKDLADELIVVNNNSTDQTAAIVRRMQRQYPEANIRLINEKEQGIVPARNRGFKVAKSEVLGRIDADSIIYDGWVKSVRNTFKKKRTAASTGPVKYHDMPLPEVGFKFDHMIRKTLHNSAKDHTFVFGSNMAIRSEAWDAIADCIHPDKDDQLHEDIDIALCLFKKNLKVVYDPDMVGGMSARRLEDRPRDFYNYVMRFERTFQVHGVKSTSARIPIFIYILIYFPVRTLRKFYDGENSKFTLRKLREDLEAIRSRDS